LSRKSQAAKTFSRQGLSSITADIPAFRERRVRASASSTARPGDLSHGAVASSARLHFADVAPFRNARFKPTAGNDCLLAKVRVLTNVK
jgi:hypothetical protein